MRNIGQGNDWKIESTVVTSWGRTTTSVTTNKCDISREGRKWNCAQHNKNKLNLHNWPKILWIEFIRSSHFIVRDLWTEASVMEKMDGCCEWNQQETVQKNQTWVGVWCVHYSYEHHLNLSETLYSNFLLVKGHTRHDLHVYVVYKPTTVFQSPNMKCLSPVTNKCKRIWQVRISLPFAHKSPVLCHTTFSYCRETECILQSFRKFNTQLILCQAGWNVQHAHRVQTFSPPHDSN